MKKKIHPKSLVQSQVELPKLTVEEEQQLDYHICCAIEELKTLLMKKPTEKQKKLAEMSLRILTNPAETFIKKKQVLRQQFGDYKQKFDSQKKQLSLSLNSNKIEFKNVNIPDSSVFIKKVKDCSEKANYLKRENSENNCEEEITDSKNNFIFNVSDNTFRFNF